ncbi:hypothetical protein DFJ77DRAFT_170299 [Powellomyces hirtus]|nr:hypothetical protein DFJ77DRAFT_170299 [Powellomyces hirtus]
MGHTLELPSGRTNDLADQVELAGRLASPMIQRDKVVRRTSNELLDLFGGSEVEDPTPSSPTESPPQTGDRTLEPRNRQKRIFQVPESQSEETTQQGSKRLRTLDTENISPSNTEQTVVSRPAAEPGHTPTPIPIVSHEGLDRLFFPDMQACTELKGKGIHREIAIPVQFRSVQVYKDTFVKALTENLQVQLTTMAMNYHRLRAEKMTEDLTTFLRNRGIPFYANCQLSWYNAPFQRGLRRPKNLILALESKEHHSVYSRDDLWVVATSPDFSSTFIARSHFYGASRNTAIELCPMSPHDVKLADAMLRQTHVAWAIRVASASSEILMMANLRDNIGKTQLLPWMLSSASQNASGRTTFKPPSAAALVTAEAADKYNALVDEVADQFHLNQDQRAVLESFAGSILKPSGSPICLVHGVFGAGKSFLVSVIIIFLHRVREAGCLRKPDKFKVMVASMTNVAVDRILLELLHLNFTDFVRVGSLKKIAKPILPFTAQAKNDKDDAKDLHDMLNSELSVSEKKDVEDTIAKFKRNENKSIVESSFLVGATCLATTFESFDWYINTVVILDECRYVFLLCDWLAIQSSTS